MTNILLVVFELNPERQHHERVGLEPGLLADRLGLLHELFRPALVAQVQVDGGEAIATGNSSCGSAASASASASS